MDWLSTSFLFLRIDSIVIQGMVKMNDADKTKAQLIAELVALRQQVVELTASKLELYQAIESLKLVILNQRILFWKLDRGRER